MDQSKNDSNEVFKSTLAQAGEQMVGDAGLMAMKESLNDGDITIPSLGIVFTKVNGEIVAVDIETGMDVSSDGQGEG